MKKKFVPVAVGLAWSLVLYYLIGLHAKLSVWDDEDVAVLVVATAKTQRHGEDDDADDGPQASQQVEMIDVPETPSASRDILRVETADDDGDENMRAMIDGDSGDDDRVSLYDELELLEDVITVNVTKTKEFSVKKEDIEFELDFEARFPHARGYHWETRWETRTGHENDTRLQGFPYEFPMYDDPGATFIPFQESFVHPKFKDTPKLVYDVLLIRTKDEYGLINDMYTEEEYRKMLQHVVNVFAVANVHVRFQMEEVSKQHLLSHEKGLAYLSYLEGPDREELTTREKMVGGNRKRAKFDEWLVKENLQTYRGLKYLDLLRGPRPADGVVRRMLMQDYLDWTLGFPMELTPWDMVFSTAVFPVHYFHNLNGIGGSGRVIIRTSSCNERVKPIIDPRTNTKIDSVTCRRFLGDVKQRIKLKGPEKRKHEKLSLKGMVGARLWAHEIGHQLTLAHPIPNKCTLFKTWDDARLMVQQRHVGISGQGCATDGHEQQGRATKLVAHEMEQLREFVKTMDVRPSRTLPNGVTVGSSTMQLGTKSPSLFSKLQKHLRVAFLGASKALRNHSCKMKSNNVTTILFNRLPSPRSGRVYRVRWMPSHWPEGDHRHNQVEIAAVERTRSGSYRMIERSGTIQVPRPPQRSHIEIDLPKPLRIGKGQFLAISSTNPGEPLRIDNRIYSSDKVLFGDVVGKRIGAAGLISALAKYDLTNFTYPKIARAHRSKSPFLFLDTPIPMSSKDLPFQSPKTECSELIFNYDVI